MKRLQLHIEHVFMYSTTLTSGMLAAITTQLTLKKGSLMRAALTILLILSGGSALTAEEAPAAGPRSTTAKLARSEYEQSLKAAEQEHKQKLDRIRKAYLERLDGILKKTMASGDLEEANRIDLEKKAVLQEGASPDKTATDELARRLLEGSAWTAQDGVLVGKMGGHATVNTSYKAISSVKIVAMINPPARNNLRIGVGPLNCIFNWEGGQENHFRFNEKLATTSPHRLVPGTEYTILIEQKGDDVVVSVDGKHECTHVGKLTGTVTIYSGNDTTLSLREVVIQGEADLSKKVTGPSHKLW